MESSPNLPLTCPLQAMCGLSLPVCTCHTLLLPCNLLRSLGVPFLPQGQQLELWNKQATLKHSSETVRQWSTAICSPKYLEAASQGLKTGTLLAAHYAKQTDGAMRTNQVIKYTLFASCYLFWVSQSTHGRVHGTTRFTAFAGNAKDSGLHLLN